VKRLPTKKVYVTVDKDCLKRQHAVTNWEEGMISLDELIIMLKIIRDNCEIAGLDITGEYSKISVDGPIKTVLSRIDHPKETWRRDTSEEAALSVNEETNIRILETLNL
jgi:hypothetical protein